MPKVVPSLIQILVIALGLTFVFVVGVLLSGFIMMGGNFGGMWMMGPSMFASMLWPTFLVAVIASAIGVVAYSRLFPNISQTSIGEIAPESYRDAVLRLLKDDERQVVEALTRSGGTAFQRDLQHAIGFSKVKTHRVIARLAERRLVEVTPAGKTNRIRIPSWLVAGMTDSSDQQVQSRSFDIE